MIESSESEKALAFIQRAPPLDFDAVKRAALLKRR